MISATFRIGGGPVILSDKYRDALTELAQDLRELQIQSELDYQPPDPNRRGLSWFEVLGIYLGGKALDAMTSYAFDALAESTLGKAIEWAKRRLRRGDTVRPQ